MIPYIENPKDATKKLLELLNEFSKVAGYKINIQKSVVLLYTSNELTKREINKAIPITILSKRIKHLRINLTKEVKDLCTEIYKTLMKELKEDTNRASLVAQWLRVCLLMQGTRVRALVWEDPTCRGAAGPVSHNC